MPEDPVGKAGVLEVVPADVVERLGSIGRPHAVHLHDDEAQVGQRSESPRGAEGLGDVRALGAGVDALDDRIFLRGVEIPGPADDAPDVGLAVAALGDEDLGRPPAAGLERRDIRLLELADELAVLDAAQLVDRGHVHPAVGVDEVAAIGRKLHRVTAVARRQGDQAGAVEIDSVVMDEVGILVRIPAAGAEPDLSLGLVDPVDAPHDVRTLGDRVLDCSGLRIDQVEVPPAVSLRHINQLVGFLEPGHGGQAEGLAMGRPDECLALLVDDIGDLAGLRVDPDHPVSLVPAIDLLIGEMPAVLVPPKPWLLEVDPVDAGPDRLLRCDLEEVQFVRRELVAGQRIGAPPQLGPPAAGGRRLDQVDLLPIAAAQSGRPGGSSSRATTRSGRTRGPPCRRCSAGYPPAFPSARTTTL